jgi:N-acetylglucosamine-6-phosphate deacetylase
MVGAALDLAAAFVGIIADGHHVHDANLRLAFAAKRHDRFMLITDAMPPAAGGPDQFDLQGRRVTRANGCLRLDDGTLAGSVLTMDEAVRYAVKVARLDLGDALAMASRVPAMFLRRDTVLGCIAPGHLASLVHLDDDLCVLETWVEGRPTADGSLCTDPAGGCFDLRTRAMPPPSMSTAQHVRVLVVSAPWEPATLAPTERSKGSSS